MKQRKTIYHLIVDKSGSMSDCIENTINGFNEQVKRIIHFEKEFLEEEITIGLTTFNHAITNHYFGASPSTIPHLTSKSYQPDGSTALMDAIGYTIKQIENDLLLIPRNLPTTVVVVILTDGYENASTSFNLEAIKTSISKLEETGKWTFSFIGATLDAVDVAEKLSIKKCNSYSFEKSEMKNMVWEKLSVSLENYCLNKQEGKYNTNLFED